VTLVPLGLLVLFLGYANGANDVSKGIATLVGSGVSNFRAAVLWGTAWTVAGGLLAAFASQGLVSTFSGKGFLQSPVTGLAFPAAVAFGAAAWVFFAARTGLPVSTTHALAGAIAGSAIVSEGVAALHWVAFAKKIALPLALSPLLAVALIYAIFPLVRRAMARAGNWCFCIERRELAVASSGPALSTIAVSPVVAPGETCASSPAIAARLSLVDGLHWLSSALTSFARAVNDTPKIVAIAFALSAAGISGFPLYAVVAAAMGAGSLIAGLRVTETLAQKVTAMSAVEGFAANAVTTTLVGLASYAALPVSTTQVSSGAIIGVGLHRGAQSIHWRTVRDILIAWLVTLPVAALLGAGAYALLSKA
jgi:PiT family inorganic phosphate transporter